MQYILFLLPPLPNPLKSSSSAGIHALSYFPLSLEKQIKHKQIKNVETTQEKHPHINQQSENKTGQNQKPQYY